MAADAGDGPDPGAGGPGAGAALRDRRRAARRRAAVAALLAAALGAALAAAADRPGGGTTASAPSATAPADRPAPPGTPAPSDVGPTSTDPRGFDLPDLRSNGHVRLRDFRGHPTVVAFFATWCTACRADLPELAEISAHLTGQVDFVGVDTLEPVNGSGFAEALGIGRWPLAHDIGERDGGLHDSLGSGGMPVTAFYAADGRLLRVAPGQQTIRRLRGELHELYGLDVPDPTD